jgi:hypothetical protein
MEAGAMQDDETFPEGTVHRLVVEQLDEFVMEWKGMADCEETGSEESEE